MSFDRCRRTTSPLCSPLYRWVCSRCKPCFIHRTTTSLDTVWLFSVPSYLERMVTSTTQNRFNRFVCSLLCSHIVTAYDKWYSTQTTIKPPTSPAFASSLPFPSFSPTKRKSNVTEEECERMRAQLLQQIDSAEIQSRKSVDSNHPAEIAEAPRHFDFLLSEKEEIMNDFGIPEPPPLPSLERFGLMELLIELEESWKSQKPIIPATSQPTKSSVSRSPHTRPFRGDGGKPSVAQRRLAQRPPVTSTRSLTFRPFSGECGCVSSPRGSDGDATTIETPAAVGGTMSVVAWDDAEDDWKGRGGILGRI